MGEMAFQVGGGLQPLPGSVPPKKHKLERNNIEREENDKMMEKRLSGQIDKFPMHTHKVGGLVREVTSEEELADALSKGWKADIRDVVEAKPKTAPTKISEMTEKQAKAFLAEHADSGAKLAEILADEQAHGARSKVLKLIEEAADALGAPKGAAKPRKK